MRRGTLFPTSYFSALTAPWF